jgi:hypothetical protein
MLAYKMQTSQWCLSQAGQIGPGCQQLIETLFAHKVLDNLRAAHRLRPGSFSEAR